MIGRHNGTVVPFLDGIRAEMWGSPQLEVKDLFFGLIFAYLIRAPLESIRVSTNAQYINYSTIGHILYECAGNFQELQNLKHGKLKNNFLKDIHPDHNHNGCTHTINLP